MDVLFIVQIKRNVQQDKKKKPTTWYEAEVSLPAQRDLFSNNSKTYFSCTIVIVYIIINLIIHMFIHL